MTFSNLPTRSGARISVMVAPQFMTLTTIPFVFLSVYRTTTSPSRVLPQSSSVTEPTVPAQLVDTNENKMIPKIDCQLFSLIANCLSKINQMSRNLSDRGREKVSPTLFSKQNHSRTLENASLLRIGALGFPIPERINCATKA